MVIMSAKKVIKFQTLKLWSKFDGLKSFLSYRVTINDDNMLAIHSIQLQKEVKSNPKQPSCKTVFNPEEGLDVKSNNVVAKKWLQW